MKTLNVRLVLILFGCVVVMGAGVWGLHSFQVHRNAYVFLDLATEAYERAIEAEEDGNTALASQLRQEAYSNFKWYLNLRGDNLDLDAMEKYGLLCAKRARDLRTNRAFGDAIKALDDLLLKDGTREEARRELVDIYLIVGMYNQAERHMGILLESTPEDGKLLDLRARCQVANGDYEKATGTFRRAIAATPDRIEAYAGLATLLGGGSLDRGLAAMLRGSNLDRDDEARQVVVDLVLSNLESTRAHYLRGLYLGERGGLDPADQALDRTDADRDALRQAIEELKQRHADLAAAVAPLPSADGGDPLAAAAEVFRTANGSPEALAELRRVATAGRQAMGTAAKSLAEAQTALLAAIEPLKLADARRDALTELVAALQVTLPTGETLEPAMDALQAKPGDADAIGKCLAELSPEVSVSQQAHETLTGSPDAFLAVVERLAATRDAAEEAAEALRLDPDDHDSLSLASRCALIRKQFTAARTHAQHGIEQHPESFQMRKALADTEAASWRAEQRAELDAAAAGRWDDVEAHRDRAVLYRDRTVAVLEEGIEATGGHVDLLWLLADVMIDACKVRKIEGQGTTRRIVATVDPDRVAKCREAVARLREAKHPVRCPEGWVEYLVARIEYEQGNWNAALRGFAAARASLTTRQRLLKECLLQLARCYGHLGIRDEEQKALEQVLKIDRFDFQARTQLAELLKWKDPEKARQLWEEIYREGRMPTAGLIHLARARFQSCLNKGPAEADWAGVLKVLNELTEAAPDSHQAVLLRSEVAVAQALERMNLAHQYQQQAAKEEDATRKRSLERVQQQCLQQVDTLYASAEQILRQARDKTPQREEYWSALMLLALRRDRTVEARQILDEAKRMLRDRVSLRLSEASLLARQPIDEVRPQLVKLAEGIEQFPAHEQVRLLAGLINVALQTGDEQRCAELCQILRKIQPDNADVRLALFETAARDDNGAAMDKLLDEIHRIEGPRAKWLFCKAHRLSLRAAALQQEARQESDSQKQAQAAEYLTQAEQHLRQARGFNASWPRVPVLMAAIYEQQGDANSAIAAYLEAFELGERRPLPVLRAVKLLYANNREAEAKQVLEAAASRGVGQTVELQRMRSAIGWEERDHQAAYEAFLKIAGDNFQDQLTLGKMLLVLGQKAAARGEVAKAQQMFTKGEQALRRALELSDGSPMAWVELIRFLAQTGQRDKALAAYQQAQAIMSEMQPVAAALALARCLEPMGQLEQAQKQYEAALSAAGDDPGVVRTVADFYVRTNKMKESETLLRKLIDGSVGTATDATWARRRLAAVLHNRGGYSNLEEAIQLIEQNVAEKNVSISDLRLMGQMLANHPNRTKRRQAIQMFEKLVQRPNADPQDRFIKAQLHLAERETFMAKREFSTLLSSEGGNKPEYIAASITALLPDTVTEARLRVNRLEELAPNWYLTAARKAEVAFAEENYQATRNVLTRYVENREAEPRNTPERQRRAAALFEQYAGKLKSQGNVAEAKSFAVEAGFMYEQYVNAHPSQTLLLASYLGRQDRIDEALVLVERVWAENHPAATAKTMAILLKSPAATPNEVQRGERIMQDCLKEFDRALQLLVVMAEARDRQGKYDEAEAFYRECLERNPRYWIAMNNLAVLQALRGTNLDESLTLINGAIDIAGPIGSLLDSRASVYMARGRVDLALADLELAIRDNPTAVRLFHQAQAYDLAGRTSEAANSLRGAEKHESGFQFESLHPLEQNIYKTLRAKLL